ncbi:Zinc finger, CCCH-type [Metarhizium album ARSEF 1941]|uniref:Zinc finger, CCCH-type n=1 Tax=Metarhizium album (strain ARSEF 1941) TaxID=1081103 RepID=A0A0B2WVM0_METAS|nr:Zinc finger, CCCH-type [Metarhizium album ARSEF 1941]KHO00172.1 Zinc finger, CCCH-type [Metarhizium album ARSEF 1941]
MNRLDLEASKKQAKDAILRLLPLHITFQNYIMEGIDEELLKSLFEDLGLKIPETTTVTSKPEEKKSATSKVTEETSSPKALDVGKRNPPKSAVVDPSESRKDRIARLLAAKGSKQSSTPASTPADDTVIPKSTKSMATSAKPTLSQSEKSRLLQQKMDALKKAREAVTQRNSTQPDERDFRKRDSTPEAPFRTRGHDKSFSAPQNDALPSIIPGLSWSPSKQGSELPPALQQSTATLQVADLSHVRSAPAFDQKTESRPFLIDVSEGEGDDDEQEMDIDSASQTETPPDMPNTPNQQYDSLRNAQAAADSSTTRQVRSPASASTPLRSASRNNGSDLESMNKQIEEMKRKIAEAEARKKAKDSRQGSPALYQPNDSPVEDASDTTSRPAALSRSYGELGHRPRAARGPGNERRSQSRAASERLPLIESRRRKQRLKLKALQFEIARIEQELEEDMLEEERLKGELLTSESDKEVETAAPVERSSSEPFKPEQPDDVEDVVGEQSLPSRGLPVAIEPTAGVGSSDAGNEGVVSTTTPPEANDMSPMTCPATEAPVRSSQASPVHSDSPEDVDMEDAGYSADEDVEENFEEDYEPPEANTSSAASAVASNHDLLEQGCAMLSQAEDVPKAGPVTSDAGPTFSSGFDLPEPASTTEPGEPVTSKTSFVPYETPLQYFHAYRFHPSFNRDVAGGLRSLTYSNEIDVKKELCPDDLAGQKCPRGSQCDFQHFDTMQAPDDQILLQLGAADHYGEEQRQKYIAGLTQLLTDFRRRKVKDFNTVGQGIIDFRARFLGDRTKILPLGSVNL